MTDLAQAVDELVETATSGVRGRALQHAVSAVVDAFDASDARGARTALKKLDASVERATGHASQVLHLTIGALVEAGAPPELAWAPVERELHAALEGATRFAVACAEAAKTPHVETALAKAGAKIAKKNPADAGAWEALPSRCLAAVACLTRSKKVRAAAREEATLLEAAYPLEDAVPEVGFLTQALRVLDDELLIAIHPATQRGFKVRMSEIGWNAELFILLSHEVTGDPKKGLLPGDGIDRRALDALKSDFEPPKGLAVVAPFNFVAWTGLASDGSLPPAAEIEEHWLSFEGVPAEIPEHDGVRVILLQDPKEPRILPLERTFEALRPKVRVEAKLAPVAVKKMLATLGKAAARAKKRRR